MAENTYGEALGKLVRAMLKYEDQADIFRRNEIPKGHYYNVINPDRTTTANNPFYCPTEWVVRLTNDSQNFSLIKQIAKDCKCLILTPNELDKLKTGNPEETLELFQEILGMVKNK